MKSSTSYYAAFTWLFHFLTAALSFVVVVAILSAAHEKMVLRAISNMTGELVQYADSTAKQVHTMLTACTYQNFYNPQVTKLRTQADVSNFDAILAIRVLNSFTSSNGFIDSVYVYNARRAYVYSTKETGSDTCGDFPDRGAVELLTSKDASYPYLIWRGDVYSLIISETDVRGVCTNAMMVNFDAKEFNKLYFQFPYDNCVLYRLDTDEIVFPDVVSENTASCDFSAIRNASALSGYITVKPRASGYAAGKKVRDTSFIYSYLADPQLYYIRCIDADRLSYELESFRTTAVQVAAIILVSWLFVSLLILIRFYVPLKKVVNFFAVQTGQNASGEDAVFNNIDQYLQKELVSKEASASILKREYLKQLLTSPAPDDVDLQTAFSGCETELDTLHPLYIVLTADEHLPGVDRPEVAASEKFGAKLPAGESAGMPREVPAAGKSAVGSAKRAPAETFRQGDAPCAAERVAVDALYAFVVQFSSEEKASAYFERIAADEKTRAVISEKIGCARDMHRAFVRLRELYAARIFYGGKSAAYERYIDTRKGGMRYPEALEAKLMQALRAGNRAAAESAYGDMMREFSEYRYAAISFNLKRLYVNLTAALNAVPVQSEEERLADSADRIALVIEQAKDISDIDAEYYALMEKICAQSEEQHKLKQKKTAERIKRIVDEQLYDAQLSSKAIADSLGLSDTYVSKLFKASENISIANYINEARMAHAKRLLLETDLTIKEIAERIGISNSQYFYVLFRKYFSVSPAQFRRRPEQRTEKAYGDD
ncbi:AraC family transcriptional regulator [Treponema socranskii]|uniref:AraC family transcriptional regulator n=1 Tax=Treponema socranskii TaxID=53419 RepID=UPI0028E18F80|nr:AraC family transcriptional regulator [Treponema socranskii]